MNWLVTVRLLLAGVILLSLQFFRENRSQICGVWKNKRNAFQLVIFGVLGMLAVQYTYMASIKHGNAAVATLLQYLAPIMIMVYLVLRKQASATKRDLLCALLSLTGCFFVLTNGSISQLSVPTVSIGWGVYPGWHLPFFTLYAGSLLKQFDPLVIVGWAMFIGGCALCLIHPPWHIELRHMTVEFYLYTIFIIFFGTNDRFFVLY